jgi:hypothetical protein
LIPLPLEHPEFSDFSHDSHGSITAAPAGVSR